MTLQDEIKLKLQRDGWQVEMVGRVLRGTCESRDVVRVEMIDCDTAGLSLADWYSGVPSNHSVIRDVDGFARWYDSHVGGKVGMARARNDIWGDAK